MLLRCKMLGAPPHDPHTHYPQCRRARHPTGAVRLQAYLAAVTKDLRPRVQAEWASAELRMSRLLKHPQVTPPSRPCVSDYLQGFTSW